MIQLRNVNKFYSSGNESVHAIKNLNVNFPDRGLVFVIGPSGGGKSTLLNLLGGIDDPTSGEVLIEGENIAELSSHEFNKFLNSYVGFVFQEYNILQNLNLHENIALSLELKGVPASKKKAKVKQIIEQVELTGFEKRKVSQLSGGQKQRIAIARALVKDPKFIIADEPTGNLDSETGQTIFELFKTLSKDRLVIIVSHDGESAHKFGDRIIEIDNGELVADSSPVKKPLAHDPIQLDAVVVPLKTSIKLALKSMFKKRIRFLSMALITGISLAFLSFMIDLRDDLLKQNIYTSVNNGYEYAEILLKKDIRGTGNTGQNDFYDQYFAVTPSIGEYEKLRGKYPDFNIFNFKTTQIDIAHMDTEANDYFYSGMISSVVEYDPINDYQLMIGRVPKPEEKEILITDYVASMLIHYQKYPFVTNMSELLNRQMDLNVHQNYKIVGIIQTNFEKWRHLSNLGYSPLNERPYLTYASDYRFMNSVVINHEFFVDESEFITPNVTLTNSNTASMYLNDDYYSFLKLYDTAREPKDLLYGRHATSPNEVVIDGVLARNLFAPRLNLNSPTTLWNDWRWRISNQTITVVVNPINDLTAKIELTLTVVGLSATGGMGLNMFDYNQTYSRIVQSSEEIIVQLPRDATASYQLFQTLAKDDYIVDMWVFRELIDTFSVDSFIILASQVGLFVFATFSIGILWTIITLEIVDSKKEIGILRSLGLSGKKVSIIFIFEVLVIGIIALTLAYVASRYAIDYFNATLFDEFGIIPLTMYVQSSMSILYLASFLVIISGLAILFPIMQISKQKIIDVINERSSI
jgi:putative ABC transport system permease protein